MSRATKNWKTLKELEKAIQVYWSAKDRLPPRVPSASHLIISPDSLIFSHYMYSFVTLYPEIF